MSNDPVSWFVIEPGWRVVDAQGEDVGSVDEVVGDSSDDIFNGLSISTSMLGRPRYVLPHSSRRADPEEALHSVLGQFGRRATAAGNIVVVQSQLGSAPAIGRVLDELQHERIVGTLAGDDTVLVIAPSERDAKTLARELAVVLS